MTVTTQTPAASASSIASSATFRTFAVVFAITTPIIYVICEMRNWPLFSYFPASGRVTLGWAPGTEAEGPAMHWYGWTAATLIGSALLGAIATKLPESMTRKIPLWLIWVLPLAAIPILIYGLKYYWRW